MLLNDISKSPDTTFSKINKYLEENYGLRLSKDCDESALCTFVEAIEGEVVELKLKGDDAKSSAEISKRLLILEAMKSLQESMVSKSPDFDKVISGMADYVCDSFCLSGTSEMDFDDCMKDAMNHYRSSKYRFPDGMVEMMVREMAMSKLHEKYSVEEGYNESLMFNEGFLDKILGKFSKKNNTSKIAQSKGAASTMKPQDIQKSADGSSDFELEPIDPWERQQMLRKRGVYNPPKNLEKDPTARALPKLGSDIDSMIKDKTMALEPTDPWEVQAAQRRKGVYTPPKSESVKMNEKQNLIKNLRRLLENEVSQAEVMMSSKDFAIEMQEMIEKIGRLQNEDLPPVTDRMREIYGTDTASTFQTKIYGALQGIMDALYTAKNEVDDAVTNLATTGTISSTVDMEKDFGPEGMGPEVDAQMGAEMGAEAGEELGTDAEIDAGLGREPKAESVENLKNKIVEMRKLVEKAKKLKEMKKGK